MQAVSKYGTDWRRVAREVVSRTPDQCSSHWSQVLDPEINHCDWTGREDEQLLHEVLTHGTNWSVIATSHVPRRTTLSLKNRYATLRLRHENGKTKEQSSQPLSAATLGVKPVDNGDNYENGGKEDWRGDGDGEDDLDGSDSGHDDESGDEDDDPYSQKLPQTDGSNSTASNLSMLPATPVDWMNYLDQSGEFPSVAFSHDASPPVAGLESNHNSHENAFVFGAILEEKGNRSLLSTRNGDAMDIMPGLSPGYPSMDTASMGTIAPSPVNTVSGNSSAAHQVSADMVCTDAQLESIIRTLVGTGAVVNLQIKPTSRVK